MTSTQDVARSAAQSDAPSRSIFVADHQTQGRGRQGRSWLAKPAQALMLSLLLRHQGEPRPWRATALCSVALAQAIEETTPVQVAIKWPNDLMIDNRKVAGVLAESTWQTVIVGIGLNISTALEELQTLSAAATTLLAATGSYVDRGLVLEAFVRRFDTWFDQPEAALHEAWQQRLWRRGQRVQLLDLGMQDDVIILGAAFDGALRVKLKDGSERVTTTAELIL